MGTWSIPGPDQPVWNRQQLAALLGISEDTIMNEVKAGRFPRPTKPSPQAQPIWSGATIAAWLFLMPQLAPENSEKSDRQEKNEKP